MLGVSDLRRLWTEPGRRGSLLSERPDAAIVAEPTNLTSSSPTREHALELNFGAGVPQLLAGQRRQRHLPHGEAAQRLEEYAAETACNRPPHPLCGPATLSVGRIEGGISVNTVPDWCSGRGRPQVNSRRRRPAAIDHCAILERVAPSVEFGFEPRGTTAHTCPTAPTRNWPTHCWRSVRGRRPVRGRTKCGSALTAHTRRGSQPRGYRRSSSAPATSQQAHTKDEWIETASLTLRASHFRSARPGTAEGLSACVSRAMIGTALGMPAGGQGCDARIGRRAVVPGDGPAGQHPLLPGRAAAPSSRRGRRASSSASC